jgi:hypothetical protein
MVKKLLFILVSILICTDSYADYWVDTNGAASWANCESGSELTGTNACSLATALANASAGDTVNLRAGTYTTAIHPANSGTNGNPITFQATSGESVIISGVNPHINLISGEDYITVKDINLRMTTNSGRYLWADGSVGGVLDGISVSQSGISYTAYNAFRFLNCTDWEIKNCTLGYTLDATSGTEMVHLLQANQRFYIHGNIFGNVTHTPLNIDSGSKYIIVRNNTFNNYWRHGIGCNRTAYYDGWTYPEYILIENNTFNEIAKDTETMPWLQDRDRNATPLAIGGHKLISRFNTFNKCDIPVFIYTSNNRPVYDHWHYHNTIYETYKYGSRSGMGGTSIASENVGSAVENFYWVNNIVWNNGYYNVRWNGTEGYLSNVNFDNNLFYMTGGDPLSISWFSDFYTTAATANSGESVFTNNVEGNPNLTNPDGGDYTLSGGSYAVDSARWIGTVSAKSGNLVTIGNNEAYAFPASNWNVPNQPISTYTIYDDDGDSYTVTDQTAHNQLTLADATNIQVGDTLTPVAFTSAAPDIGRYEYSGTPQNVLPTVSIDTPSGPQTIAVDGSVSFSCTASDSDGSIASYLWTFDASGIANDTSEDPGNKTFSAEGNYTVTVTVTDNSGGQASDSVEIQVGTPAAPTPYYEWEMEAANVVLDDQGNDNLTNNGSITTGGTEPDPPGYGSVGAVLNDAIPQYFSLTNANIGNAVCNGTDTDCTIIIAFRSDDLQTDYLYSIYQASSGERQLALGLFSGTPNFLWGYNDGDSYQNITISNTFTAGEDIIIGLSLNASAKTYTFLAQDVATGEYSQRTNSDTALTGTYNTGSSPLTIGTRSDGSTDRAFDGTIYWVRVYDDALSRSEMETVFENTAAVGDIERCFVTEQKTFTTDDTVTVRCDLSSSTTVDKTGGTPYIELETGGTDLQCSLDTGNGSGIEQLEFSGTVLAGMTASLINVTANGIQLNGGSLGGIDDTVATSGPGSIGYESQAAIDTSAIGSVTTMDVCDSDGNEITTNTLWKRAEYGNLKICWGEGAYFNSGPIEDIVIPFTITAGSPIDFKYAGTQPSGMGVSEACWLFEALIESDMEEKVNVTMDAVSDTTHGSTIIQDIEGNEISSYDMPQVQADGTYEVRIKGTPGFIFKAE